jgi:hypothetical protein
LGLEKSLIQTLSESKVRKGESILGFADYSIHGVASHDVTVLGELWVRTSSSRERFHRNLPGGSDLFVVGDYSVKNGSEVGALARGIQTRLCA